MPEMSVTEDEIRAEAAALFNVPDITDDPHAKTTAEWAQLYKLSEESMRKRISKLCREGKMDAITVWRVRSGGRGQRMPAYRVVREQEKSKESDK